MLILCVCSYVLLHSFQLIWLPVTVLFHNVIFSKHLWESNEIYFPGSDAHFPCTRVSCTGKKLRCWYGHCRKAFQASPTRLCPPSYFLNLVSVSIWQEFMDTERRGSPCFRSRKFPLGQVHLPKRNPNREASLQTGNLEWCQIGVLGFVPEKEQNHSCLSNFSVFVQPFLQRKYMRRWLAWFENIASFAICCWQHWSLRETLLHQRFTSLTRLVAFIVLSTVFAFQPKVDLCHIRDGYSSEWAHQTNLVNAAIHWNCLRIKVAMTALEQCDAAMVDM